MRFRTAEKPSAIIRYAKEWGFEPPFVDWDTFKVVALETVKEEIRFVGKRATILGKQAVLIVVGFVVAVSLFLNSNWDLEGRAPNLYSLVCAEVAEQFKSLYRSFATVMGA
jgi:hypothetical protein